MQSKYMVPVSPVHGSNISIHVITIVLYMIYKRAFQLEVLVPFDH